MMFVRRLPLLITVALTLVLSLAPAVGSAGPDSRAQTEWVARKPVIRTERRQISKITRTCLDLAALPHTVVVHEVSFYADYHPPFPSFLEIRRARSLPADSIAS